MTNPLLVPSHPKPRHRHFLAQSNAPFLFAAHTRHKTGTAHFVGEVPTEDSAMTYANRALKRDQVIKVRLSVRDFLKLEQLQRETGEQKASLARDLLLAQLDIAMKAQGNKGP